ncbi:MAG: hypothetical protein NDJ94_24230 [Vicinamibacteria bacterium]|jgi:hypothetical protein|nr:hypothetical protein [Vicinamibacteria bacterium]
MKITYRIDAQDRLTELSGDWDQFAQANGAPELAAAALRGKPLPALVSGTEMQSLTAMLLKRAREAGAVEVPFRCDAPDERRFLTMELRRDAEDGVAIETRLVRAEPRPPVALLDARLPRTDELLVICSWCKCVRLPTQEWVEVEAAVEALGLFQEAQLPQLSHGICPPCRARFFGAPTTRPAV